MDLLSWIRSPEQHLATRRYSGGKGYVESVDRPLRVAHLTDQHVGLVTPDALQVEAIRRINAEDPDLVVLTGDYIAHGLDYVERVKELLTDLKRPAIATLGNHDHWADPKMIQRALEDIGIPVLNNAWTELEINGQRLQVVGVDDAFTGHADVEKATKGLNPNLPTLGLSHVGDEADELWARGVPLVLSGHTHSGQIAVGGLHNVLMGQLAGHRYVHGLYGCREQERAPGAVYVSAGIGSSRFGLRLGEKARPEVSIFTLGEDKSVDDGDYREQRPVHDRVVSPEVLERRRAAALKKQRKRSAHYQRKQSAKDESAGE